MATGAGEDTRDEDAADYVRKRGFDVIPLARPEPEPEQPAPEPEPAAPEPDPPAESPAVREENPAEPAAPVAATGTTPPEPQGSFPDDEREDLLVALEIFDGDERALPEWLDWESTSMEPLALAHEGRLYPAAEIIRLATGTQEALTAEQASGYLRRHGFDVVALRPTVTAAPRAPAAEPAATPRTAASTRDIAATAKAYAALVQCDLREHIEWLRAGLDLGMLLDESPLLDAASRETLGLARFLWADLERRHAPDFTAPALLLIDVLEHAAAQALRGAALPPGVLDSTLEGLVAHRAAVESALAGWQAHIARGQQYTAAQWLDALPIVTAIRARAASEPLSLAAFQELINVLCGSPLCGAGVLNGLLSACNTMNSRAPQ